MKDSIDIYEEERPWGNFRRFTQNVISTVKIITINPNQELSLQSHQKREEFWRVIRGSGTFLVDNVLKNVSIGDEQYIPLSSHHKMTAGGDGMEILEIGFGDFDENDIVRYEDKYGRV